MSYSRTGASIGNKINPLMKVEVFHSGIDLVARQGETVYAAADGVVSNVVRSSAGLGNIVEIDHGNGYVSRYALLGDNIPVSRGMRIKAGRKIGYVGISRGSFAPHLHYEILYKGEALDPVNFLFASISPDEYANMLFMSVSTGQSLD
jgi:murein DD-endopeptidase MepM/ murein hydrolase activator NlpD